LLADQQSVSQEVHVVNPQPEDLALTEPGASGHQWDFVVIAIQNS
jgi:hypothetical protein